MPAFSVKASDGTKEVQRIAPATADVYAHNSAATTNATVVKASEGVLLAVVASNVNAAARFLKLYNKASAPTVGTDRPVLTVPIPATGVVSVELGTLGMRFSLGIAFAITTAAADTDTTATAANEQKVLLSYI